MPRGLNDYDSAKIQGRLWTPETLPWISWHDFNDLSTIGVDGSGVNAAREKTGNGRDFAMTNNTYKAAAKELATGKWAFDCGSTSVKFVSSSSDWASTAKTAISCHRFVNVDGTGGFGPVLSFKDVGATTWAETSFVNTTVNPGYQARSFCAAIPTLGSGGVIGRGISDATSNNVEIFVWTYDGVSVTSNSSYQARLNGASKSVIASGSFGFQNSSYISAFGARAAASTTPQASVRFGGEIMEIMFANNVLSLRDLQLVEGYLSWKWGIPLAADHPYANRPPLIGD